MRGGELTMRRLMRLWVRRRSRALVTRLDRLRRVDMIVDFFGEGPAPVAIPAAPAEVAARVACSRAEAGVQPVSHPKPEEAVTRRA
jgi:hypothetical protein